MHKILFILIGMIISFLPEIAIAKVYDCFLFFNELDVLEIRLNELYDHVDHFVLVESKETFQGNPKPLYYDENKNRFEKFADKIIHIIVEERAYQGNPWNVEAFQRNQIMRGLKNCHPDDTILVSDVDEIPRANILPVIYQWLYDKMINPLQCEQPICRFYLNVKDYCGECPGWGGTCATTYEKLCSLSPESLRVDRKGRYPKIKHAGWHFTSMGGIQKFVQKLESFSHSEQNLSESKTSTFILNYMRGHCSFVPINEGYPRFVLENLPLFIEKGLVYEPFVSSEIRVNQLL